MGYISLLYITLLTYFSNCWSFLIVPKTYLVTVLIVDIYCPFATKWPPAPQIQAFLYDCCTNYKLCMYVFMYAIVYILHTGQVAWWLGVKISSPGFSPYSVQLISVRRVNACTSTQLSRTGKKLGMWRRQLKFTSVRFGLCSSNPSDSDANLTTMNNLATQNVFVTQLAYCGAVIRMF